MTESKTEKNPQDAPDRIDAAYIIDQFVSGLGDAGLPKDVVNRLEALFEKDRYPGSSALAETFSHPDDGEGTEEELDAAETG